MLKQAALHNLRAGAKPAPIHMFAPFKPLTAQEELTATWDRESFAKGDNDSPQRWIIGWTVCGKKLTGNARRGELRHGDRYRFVGRWKTDPRFPCREFAFGSFSEVEPCDLRAIEKYLQKAPGIGPAKASSLVAQHGQAAVEAVRNGAAGPDAAEFFRLTKELETLTIDVEGLLANRHFPCKTSAAAIEKWGSRAAEIIRENPFELRQFRGCGFNLCDGLWLHLGLPADDLRRQIYAAAYAVESDTSGSTWLPREKIVEFLREKITRPDFDAAIAGAIAVGILVERIEIGTGRQWYADADKATAEARFCEFCS